MDLLQVEVWTCILKSEDTNYKDTNNQQESRQTRRDDQNQSRRTMGNYRQIEPINLSWF